LAAPLKPFFAFFEGVRFEVFFLATTTNSLNIPLKGGVQEEPWDAYRVASASIENTEKTSGFRSRL
jgi:hypothetical protein